LNRQAQTKAKTTNLRETGRENVAEKKGFLGSKGKNGPTAPGVANFAKAAKISGNHAR